MDFEAKRIELTKPLKHGKKDVTELVFGREMVAGDLRGIPVADMCFDHILTVASRITGYPPSVLAQLNGADFTQVGEVVMGFLGGGQEIGQQDSVSLQ